MQLIEPLYYKRIVNVKNVLRGRTNQCKNTYFKRLNGERIT